MDKIKLLFCAAVLFTGCALSDFSDYENHDLLSLNQEMSLTSKQVYNITLETHILLHYLIPLFQICRVGHYM
jgi:hypothetical protein